MSSNVDLDLDYSRLVQYDQNTSPKKTSQEFKTAIAVTAIIAGCVAWGMAISLIGQAVSHETLHVSTAGWLFVGIGGTALLTTIGLVAARHFHRKGHQLQDDLRSQMELTALQFVLGPLAIAGVCWGGCCLS